MAGALGVMMVHVVVVGDSVRLCLLMVINSQITEGVANLVPSTLLIVAVGIVIILKPTSVH